MVCLRMINLIAKIFNYNNDIITKYYLYYVEGEDDKKVVDTLKKDMKLIIPGIARVFNVVENVLTNSRLITIKENTTVILVFDTDTGKVDKVKKNI